MKELLLFIEINQDSYRAWVGAEAQLQKGSDLIAPLIPFYEEMEKTNEVSIGHCQSCILDMIRWALRKLKESKEVENPKPKKSI